MAKPKEGRRRTSRLDMSTEAGRQLLRDLIHYNESGFSPFVRESYESEKFWRSREEYQAVSFGAFKVNARNMASIAIAQMPSKERKIEEAKIRDVTIGGLAEGRYGTAVRSKEAPILQDGRTGSSSSNQYKSTRVQSLRDTIVAPYPSNEMAIVIFELDGDVDDESAIQLEFSQNGQQIAIHGRVPKELTNAALLMGATKGRSSIQDADCVLLDQVIKERLKGSEKDENGDLWETRDVIDLPFSCKKCLFNKYGQKLESYLLRNNNQGYAWGYFWVIGEHVGQKEEYPKTIRCGATSDEEHNEDEESDDGINTNQFTSSDDELENMSVQYEETTDDSAIKKMAQLQDQLDAKTGELDQLKTVLEKELESLKEQLEVKTGEAKHFSDKLQQEYLLHQEEKAKLSQTLEAKIEEAALKDDCYKKESNKQKAKIHQLLIENQAKQEHHEKFVEMQQEKMNQLELQAQRQLEARANEYTKCFDTQKQRIQELEHNLHLNDTKYEEDQRTIQDLKKSNKSLDLQVGALQGEIKLQESKYMNLIQQSDEKHQEQQCTIHDLEQSNDYLNVKLGNLRSELKMQKINHKKLLETRQARVQELEHQLLQMENQCGDHLQQIEWQKRRVQHQRQYIRDLKMRIDTLQKLKCCCNKQFSDGWEFSLNDEGSTDDTRHNQQEVDKADCNETGQGFIPGQKGDDSSKNFLFQTVEGDRSTEAPRHMENDDIESQQPQPDNKDYCLHDGSTAQAPTQTRDDPDGEKWVEHDNVCGEERNDEKPQAEIEEFVERDSTAETQRAGTVRNELETNAENDTSSDMINAEITRPSPAKVSFIESPQVGKMKEHSNKNQSRKRKSDVIGDSQHEHSNKKLRKSARLQEKRLAKQKKD